MNRITNDNVNQFEKYLINNEKSPATIEKYMRDVRCFAQWLAGREFDKADVLLYKNKICNVYAPSSVNTIISSLNAFFKFNGWFDLRVKFIKLQRRIFSTAENELTKAEYERLLLAAKRKKNKRLYWVMQTICSTGIRVSELQYITVDSVRNRLANINCKGKIRQIFLPKQLCAALIQYAKEQQIKTGSIFITSNGKPLNRGNIWTEMKHLCKNAGVNDKKVFPHNLRHLFARTYYSVQRDVVRLADILGHSSIETTRIYTMESGEIHRKQIERLGLLQCMTIKT